MGCYRYERVGFEDNICSMENSFSAKVVNNPVFLWIYRKLQRVASIEEVSKAEEKKKDEVAADHDDTNKQIQLAISYTFYYRDKNDI